MEPNVYDILEEIKQKLDALTAVMQAMQVEPLKYHLNINQSEDYLKDQRELTIKESLQQRLIPY